MPERVPFTLSFWIIHSAAQLFRRIQPQFRGERPLCSRSGFVCRRSAAGNSAFVFRREKAVARCISFTSPAARAPLGGSAAYTRSAPQLLQKRASGSSAAPQ